MATVPNPQQYLGKNINVICGNGFHDPNSNHCAHFVSHAVGLTFSFNCKEFVGGNKPAANVRVHEIFANCPRVGVWANANIALNQLIFVTRKDVVNVATKTMQNIPEKHIGVYYNGDVYHYSNTKDRVVKQSVNDFFTHFQNAYSGDQGLFFGEVPNSDLMLTIDMGAAAVAHPYAFALSKANDRWSAQRTDVPGASFLVGVEVHQPAKNYHGLYFPIGAYYGPSYDPKDYLKTIDHWAYLLDVTAFCESKNRFNLINTYDRARFTYGFYQLAAHTPRDNLILFFRAALLDAEFQKLFPDLKLMGGKVFRVAQDGTSTDLEEEFYDAATEEMQIKRFMTYLNPERTLVDEQEVLQAARLVWWANTSSAGRDIQVNVASSILQRKFSQRYTSWYDLDGKSDVICAIVADIHHQGRGSKSAVRNALAANNKVAALLKIGKEKHPERVKSLSERIKQWTDSGKMGKKKYRADLNQFE